MHVYFLIEYGGGTYLYINHTFIDVKVLFNILQTFRPMCDIFKIQGYNNPQCCPIG